MPGDPVWFNSWGCQCATGNCPHRTACAPQTYQPMIPVTITYGAPRNLTDADVEAIARRVAELLRG